jgi:uncharacterized protein
MSKIPSYILLRIIDLYAVTIGPHFGGRCRFEPSCSVYAKEAIHFHGPLKGSGLAVARVVKCGPWHKGGYDPVPPARTPLCPPINGGR